MDFLAAADISRAIKNKDISCVEFMHFTLDRISTLNPQFNAVVSLADGDQLLELR